MRGEVSIELPISAPASEVWAAIGSRETPKLIQRLLSDFIQRIDIVAGDGGAGSVLHVVLSQGEPREWTEEFVVIDPEKRIKKIRMIKGGFLDLGFQSYDTIYEILEIRDACSCIFKSSIVFEADDEKFSASASLISANSPWVTPNTIAKYVTQNKAA